MTSKKRLVIAAALAAVVLAGCDSGGSGRVSGSNEGAHTVGVRQVDGVGKVLVDATGRTLYASDQEATGQVLCTADCVQFWVPLSTGGTPTAAAGISTLGVVTRPDGTTQVTIANRPLYTFTQDSPGQAKGNGLSDSFGNQQFTWHAVTADGNAMGGAPGSSTAPKSGYGYGY